MPPRAHVPIVETLVGELAAAPSRDACDRLFLQALVRLELCSAASLWRCGANEPEATRWSAVRSCGATERLPDDARLAAAARATDDVLVPTGVLRVRAPGAQLFAADCRADSAQAELAHALFLVWRSAAAALPTGDVEAAALPAARAPGPRGAAPTLVELLRARCAGPCLRLEGLPARSLSRPLAPGLLQVLDEVLAPVRGDDGASVRVFESRGPRAGLVLVLESAAPVLARATPASVRSHGGAWTAHPTPQGGSRCQVWLPAQ